MARPAHYKKKRPSIEQPIDPSIRYIPLTKNQVAIVDVDDYDWLNQWNWTAIWAEYRFYAERRVRLTDGKIGHLKMHHLIMGIEPTGDIEIDHRDGNGLNNRRSNLRLATQSQQAQNRPKHVNGFTSRFKGVDCRNGHWRASLMANGVRKQYQFDTEEEAARAYDAMAFEKHGEFARLNFKYAHGEIPSMPPVRKLKKRGAPKDSRWKWDRSKRKSTSYRGESSLPPLPPKQFSVELL